MSYPGHPKGCPNYNERSTCPPSSPKLEDVFDIQKGFWVVWNEFDIAAHTCNMIQEHPDWTERQSRCCLYWQQTARKQLEKEIQHCLYIICNKKWQVARTPEAMGMDVTATMKSIGVDLEWPPVRIARQIAIIGCVLTPKKPHRRKEFKL